MFIDLVDSLRCIEPHEETWLVAAVSRMDGRHIIEGTLGCPICRREYAVRDGVGWFTDPATPDVGPPHPTASRADAPEPSDSALVLRAAALLGLTEPGGLVLLAGSWSDIAPALAELTRAHFLAVNPAQSIPFREEISVVRTGERLPLAGGALRAAAFDPTTASPAVLGGAVRALRAGGRLVAPASQPLPNETTELARDARDWVAERAAPASAPVSIRGARRG